MPIASSIHWIVWLVFWRQNRDDDRGVDVDRAMRCDDDDDDDDDADDDDDDDDDDDEQK